MEDEQGPSVQRRGLRHSSRSDRHPVSRDATPSSRRFAAIFRNVPGRKQSAGCVGRGPALRQLGLAHMSWAGDLTDRKTLLAAPIGATQVAENTLVKTESFCGKCIEHRFPNQASWPRRGSSRQQSMPSENAREPICASDARFTGGRCAYLRLASVDSRRNKGALRRGLSVNRQSMPGKCGVVGST